MSPTGQTARNGPLYYRAVSYVDRMLAICGPSPGEPMQHKELAFGITMAESVFSQKRKGIRSHFFEDEFEAIAEFFRHHTGRPLTGFPHIKWEVMEGIDRKMFGWKA